MKVIAKIILVTVVLFAWINRKNKAPLNILRSKEHK